MKPPRNFITIIKKKRRLQGIVEPTPLPDDKPVEKLPTRYAEGYRTQKIKPTKNNDDYNKWWR